MPIIVLLTCVRAQGHMSRAGECFSMCVSVRVCMCGFVVRAGFAPALLI